MNDSRNGRTLLLTVGLVVVVLAALVGFFVGANGSSMSPTLLVFGVVALPMTPYTVATYAATLTLVVLALLFGAVTLASRAEQG